VRKIDIPSAGQKSISLCSRRGRARNNTKDGMTNQKMSLLNIAICSVSLVSLYNQIIAKMEINGKEARKAPRTSFFFAISLAPTIIPPERRTLNASCNHAIPLV
jgi:hypothetical protein